MFDGHDRAETGQLIPRAEILRAIPCWERKGEASYRPLSVEEQSKNA